MAKAKIKIKQDPEKEIATEVMVQAILDISRGCKILLRGDLKREAIIALIHDRSKVNKGVIEIVLNNLENLEHYWLRSKPTK